jgi:hypothetical protein
MIDEGECSCEKCKTDKRKGIDVIFCMQFTPEDMQIR